MFTLISPERIQAVGRFVDLTGGEVVKEYLKYCEAQRQHDFNNFRLWLKAHGSQIQLDAFEQELKKQAVENK